MFFILFMWIYYECELRIKVKILNCVCNLLCIMYIIVVKKSNYLSVVVSSSFCCVFVLNEFFSEVTSVVLRHPNALDDLEYSGATDHKNEESHQPWSDGIFIISLSGGLWNISSLSNHFTGFLIRNPHSLFGNHFHWLIYRIERQYRKKSGRGRVPSYRYTSGK